MMIRYSHEDDAWENFGTYVKALVQKTGAKRIAEVGAGANPTLAPEDIRAHAIDYTLFDISEEELAKAPDGYRKLIADFGDPAFQSTEQFDLVFSKMVAEHVKDGRTFHRNIRTILRDGGRAFHFFPTLYAPPFVVNRLLPDWLSEAILRVVQPGRDSDGHHGKFTAYYNLCRGPMHSQIKTIEQLGYAIDEYVGFFGHAVYYMRIPIARNFHSWLVKKLIAHPVPLLTSFAYVSLTKK